MGKIKKSRYKTYFLLVICFFVWCNNGVVKWLFRILRLLFALVGFTLIGGLVLFYVFYTIPKIYTFEFLDNNKLVVSNEVFNVALGLIITVVLFLIICVGAAIVRRIFNLPIFNK